jgi:hypothetical protein
MIDGVKCSCAGLDANLWRNNPLLDFGISVSETTGELLNQKREAKVRSLYFVLSPMVTGGFSCSLTGSLHKYKNVNAMNWDDFTFSEIIKVIENLTNDYGIVPETAFIHSLEIGVNLELDYSPEIVFKNAVCHKGKSFDNLNGKNRRLGVVCEHTDYSVKLYDKSYQCKITDKHILRYELKLHRQRMLQPFDVATLADLTQIEKVAPLIYLLLERLNEIVFFDFSFKPKQVTESKLLSWKQYGNPRYWEHLDRKNYYKARIRYIELIKKYNCIDWLDFVLKRVSKKWLELSEIKQEKGRRFPHYLQGLKAQKKGTFSNLECMLESVALATLKSEKKKEHEKDVFYCISCGRQLTGQKTGSRFCSEKIWGKGAKKCRNKDSNQRLNLKRKIYRAMEKECMLRITYRNKEPSRSQIVGAKEINLTREWLDKISRVDVLQPIQKIRKNKEIKDFINKL